MSLTEAMAAKSASAKSPKLEEKESLLQIGGCLEFQR
jgi:hypothetical protein